MERRLAAILAADVAGYTALMGADEAGTLRRFTDLRQEFIEPLIEEHRGRVVKLMGDGLLVEFASVVDAVTCAIAWQNGLAERDESAEKKGLLRFRIGINLGDVIVDGSDIHGDGVNIAARLEALAEPGGICLSDDAYRQAKGKTETGFEDLGEQELKNVAEPVRVYRVAGSSAGPAGSAPAKDEMPVPDKPSIAVLPFDNLSADPEQQYLVDGIVEDIITELSRFRNLFVIARNSTFAYKGKAIDIRQVARDLGVRYVMEGSVRRGGSRVRIVCQLIDSEAGSHVWAEKYDRDLHDVFALQEEITRQVIGNIAPQIELAELERSHRLSHDDLTAYERALKAQALYYEAIQTGSAALNDQAIQSAEAALALDPRSSHALWITGLAYLFNHLFRWSDDPQSDLKRAEEIASRFAEVDQSNAKSHILRGWVYQFYNDHDSALMEYRRAQELNPNSTLTLLTAAWGKSLMGLTDEAKQDAHLALRLSPHETNFWLGEAYLALTQACFAEGDYEVALEWGLKSVHAGGSAPIRRALVASAYGHLGNPSAARPHIDVLRSKAPEFLSALLNGDYRLYKGSEHNQMVVEGLKLAGASN